MLTPETPIHIELRLTDEGKWIGFARCAAWPGEATEIRFDPGQPSPEIALSHVVCVMVQTIALLDDDFRPGIGIADHWSAALRWVSEYLQHRQGWGMFPGPVEPALEAFRKRGISLEYPYKSGDDDADQ